VEDITFNCIGDYYEAKTKETDEEIGAIINIGQDKTDVSVFNKGILIKNSIFNLGSKNIDNVISYIYGTDTNTSRELKEKFALASRRYADINEMLEFDNDQGEKKSINQYEITEVVEARVVELLKLAKKEINDLTKRKISYIIITGGITELMGFSYVAENILGINTSTLNISTMGIRSNKYSSAIGIIKYFHDKMKLREKNISLIDDESVRQIEQNKQSMLDLTEDTFISKIFGYFADN
ncbi:MAG: cell division FtsA domain-containing protein, partial [Clostridia bacterium]|nr:cell division FtsA domain-containing protein [Clostridia bacterium]